MAKTLFSWLSDPRTKKSKKNPPLSPVPVFPMSNAKMRAWIRVVLFSFRAGEGKKKKMSAALAEELGIDLEAEDSEDSEDDDVDLDALNAGMDENDDDSDEDEGPNYDLEALSQEVMITINIGAQFSCVS